MIYRMERIEEQPHLEQLESMLTPSEKLPAWATRAGDTNMPSHLAECQGCIAEQQIRHTCGMSDDGHSSYRTQPGHDRIEHTCHVENGQHPGTHYFPYPEPRLIQPDPRGVPPDPRVGAPDPRLAHGHPHIIPPAEYRTPYTMADSQAYRHTPPNAGDNQDSRRPYPASSGQDTHVSYTGMVQEHPVYSMTSMHAGMPPNFQVLDNRGVPIHPHAHYNYGIPDNRTGMPPLGPEYRSQYYTGYTHPPGYDGYGIPHTQTTHIHVDHVQNHPPPYDEGSLKTAPTNTTTATNTSPDTSPQRQDKRRTGDESELETVKKGTPLYGQPAWWGEDEKQKTEGGKGDVDSPAERPLTLDITRTGSGTENRLNMDAPCDSLETENKASEIQHSPPERDTNGSQAMEILAPGEGNKDVGGSTVAGPPMAFTIDFGEEDTGKAPKISMQDSISKFLPHKVRKSFRGRTKTDEDSESPKEPNAPDIVSPGRQRKIEDLWTNGSKKSSKPGLRSTGYLSDGHGSAPESDFDEMSVRSDNTQKDGRKQAAKASVKSQPAAAPAPTKSLKTSKTKVNQQLRETSDSTQFLINKMFEGNGKSPSAKKDQPTEYALYKEAETFDQEAVDPSQAPAGKDSSTDFRSKTLPRPKKSDKEPVMGMKKSRSSEDHIEDDRGSETGTYTIGTEKPDVEEVDARKSIDQVFGLVQTEDTTSGIIKRPVIDKGDTPEPDYDDGEDGVEGREAGEGSALHIDEDMDRLERARAAVQHAAPADSMDPEVGSAVEVGTRNGGSEHEPASDLSPDAPRWVTQWASRTSQKTVSVSEFTPAPSKEEPSVSAGRKLRPGTGRKLPTPPVVKGSPVGGAQSPLDIYEVASPTRPRASPLGHDTRKSTDSAVIGDLTSHRGQCVDGKSVASMDTEVLLRDTEDVMAAMAARVQNRGRHSSSGRRDSDTESDTSSTCAIVNGGSTNSSLLYGRNIESKPPKAKAKSANRMSTSMASDHKQEVTAREKVLLHLQSRTGKRTSLPAHLDAGNVVNDVLSDDVLSESSTDISETSPKFTRKGSKGKGQVQMTARPNRTLQLRRNRLQSNDADSSSEVSTTSTVKSSRPGSAGTSRTRSGSMGTSAGNRTDRSQKSDASLGAKIVRRSRENVQPSTGFTRSDGGRYSMRATKSGTNKTTSKPSSTERQADIKALKSKLTSSRTPSSMTSSTGGGRNNRSQPASRSTSPRSQEYSAWKRRKDYDPRKAVASAKAKAKDSRPHMKRSASFSTAEEFEGRLQGQQQDARSVTSSYDSTFEDQDSSFGGEDEIAKFSSSMAQDLKNLSLGTDDEEPRAASASTGSSFSMVSTSRSAFSVPLTKSPSPLRSPQPVPPPRRRARAAPEARRADNGVAKRKEWEKCESYDSLIVSSIYQLSLKLKTSTDRIVAQMREQDQVSGSPSPIDDLLNEPLDSEIPAWKTANQELAGVLRNLRKTEHHVQVIDRVMNPDKDGARGVAANHSNHKEYLKQIERIRNEIAGFEPIDKPNSSKPWTKGRKETSKTKGATNGGEFDGDEYY